MEASSRAIAYPPSTAFPAGLRLFGDERLARLVAKGNEHAFTVLFERYHQPLYRYCASIIRHEVDAQDALQSTFTAAWVALRRAQRDAPLRPWLFRIAHNESISLLRRRRVPGPELQVGPAPNVSSAEESAAGRERLTVLMADLQDLPDRQRGALVMRELSGLSHEEIAAALSTSPGTAKQAIFEARSALLEFAEGRAMSCDEICRRISDGDGRALRGRRVRAHLRDCGSCAAFAAAIPARRSDLHALAMPLAPLAAASVLGRLTGAGSALTGAGGRTAGTLAGKLAGAGLTGKTLVTAVVVAGTAASVAGTLTHLHQADLRSGPARGGAGAAAMGAGQLRGDSPVSSVASQVLLERGASRAASQDHPVSMRGQSAPAMRARPGTRGRSGSASAWGQNMARLHGRANSSHHTGRGRSPGSVAHGNQQSAAAQGQSSPPRQPVARGSSRAPTLPSGPTVTGSPAAKPAAAPASAPTSSPAAPKAGLQQANANGAAPQAGLR